MSWLAVILLVPGMDACFAMQIVAESSMNSFDGKLVENGLGSARI